MGCISSKCQEGCTPRHGFQGHPALARVSGDLLATNNQLEQLGKQQKHSFRPGARRSRGFFAPGLPGAGHEGERRCIFSFRHVGSPELMLLHGPLPSPPPNPARISSSMPHLLMSSSELCWHAASSCKLVMLGALPALQCPSNSVCSTICVTCLRPSQGNKPMLFHGCRLQGFLPIQKLDGSVYVSRSSRRPEEESSGYGTPGLM